MAARHGPDTCPINMADGRLFTDYRPRCDIQMQFQAPMSGSYEYRQWLIANGKRIADHQRAMAREMTCCAPCKDPLPIGTMLPETDQVICDKVGCTRVRMPGAKGGLSLGTGRDYGKLPHVQVSDERVLRTWENGCRVR